MTGPVKRGGPFYLWLCSHARDVGEVIWRVTGA